MGRQQKSVLIGWREECGVYVAPPCDDYLGSFPPRRQLKHSWQAGKQRGQKGRGQIVTARE